jgi:exopolysaccharide biosynthesis predicted pyruvyltransferase EpsI
MAETVQPVAREEALQALRRRAEAVLDDVLGAEATVVIPDGANTSNCGDCAIFLGLQEYLRARPGHRLAFIGEWQTPRRAMARALSSDAIFLFSGGNGLGDVWAEDQRCREEFITAFRGHRMVLAPQSIHFSDPVSLDRARRVLGSHPNVTVLCRDRVSYELAKGSFDVRTELCPDAAFLLQPVERTTDPTLDVLWLARSDHEAVLNSSPNTVSVPAGVEVSDWIVERPVGRYRRPHAVVARATSKVLSFTARRGHTHRALNPAMQRLYVRLAQSQVCRGINYLSRASVVITDRLHGHIYCTLLGIRHIVLPSADGKAENLLSTWTHSIGLAQRCQSAREALELATSLARDLGEGDESRSLGGSVTG